jgi:undecaprenyl phosphate-alpha-L-ara4N flippase subunit ArnE
MWRGILLVTIQCLFFAGGQIFLKLAMMRMPKFSFSGAFFGSLFTNGPLIASGLCMLTGTLMWMYVLRKFELSVVYPIMGISYIFGLLAAILVFHETVPLSRWIGVALIMAGVAFVAK